MMTNTSSHANNRYWLLILTAACFEVLWVIGLKHASGFWAWSGTVAAIIISFVLLVQSSRKLPTSTAYAVFVGLGTAGTVIADMTIFGEPFRPAKLALIGLLLVGIIGLKTVADHKEPGNGAAKREGH